MGFSVQDIANSIGVEAVGDTTIVVEGVTEPALANAQQIALAMDPKYAGDISNGSARVAMLWQDANWQELGLEAALLPTRPRFALSGLSKLMDRGQGFQSGIHPTAIIDETAILADNVSVGALSIVGAGASIGANTVIGPQVYIGMNSRIGDECLLREGTKIGADVHIGDRFIAQQNVSVGGDGFSFVTPETSAVEEARGSLGGSVSAEGQAWARIHSLAGVEIGNDVELGSGTCVDRGTVKPTRIGNGVKADSLVQVGHNVTIGNHCLLCAQAGVAGSTILGDFVVLGGQSGVADNVTVGNGVIAGGGTKILSNVPAGRAVLGYPAVKMDSQVEIYKALRRLPRLMRDFDALKKSVFNGSKTK
ncbi:MAG: UDP-3-O-(3-hydroxymyristoyl)glucosamine N-acyltransferase [Paracoccaceae bacterium]|nr:UDP-3-O-(3-hydroxymyristoyl)glucosamine N-acyltransferase [Paracoccaceae bacterium]MDG1737889.1 UDP-3-O-(3-hydroxymyristoyl)glucosamine N-acyltransferase [Paracoccaceae bacterium]MDG2259076.1 UDP-3-O-(3-hydroxymyristoyl)glucosamine N-acyltransferase [Paracoccaceae bacterium]